MAWCRVGWVGWGGVCVVVMGWGGVGVWQVGGMGCVGWIFI